MTYQLIYLEDVKKDLESLDGSQRILVNKSLKRIQERGMQAGEALKGSLSGCHKLKHKKAGLRVVFRESSAGIEIIEIIAIGMRSDSDVYNLAMKRIR